MLPQNCGGIGIDGMEASTTSTAVAFGAHKKLGRGVTLTAIEGCILGSCKAEGCCDCLVFDFMLLLKLNHAGRTKQTVCIISGQVELGMGQVFPLGVCIAVQDMEARLLF